MQFDDNALTALADLAVDHPDLGLLWLREMRHLPADEQKSIDRDVYRMIEQLASNCRRVRPELETTASELLAWSLLGVLLSASFHAVTVDRGVYRSLLVALLERVMSSPVAPGLAIATAPKEPVAGLEPLSRREALLIQATRLFAQHRYSGVGNEDIGDALGMSGPNIYNHFTSKSELLGRALQRGAGYLQLQLAEVLSRASTPTDGLRGLITSYTSFAVAHPDLVAILMTEIRNLAEPHRQAALTAQRDYVNEWTHLIQQRDPSTDPAQARLKVHAALTIINAVSQVDRLRTAAQSVDAISGVVGHMLLSHQEN
ncbi:TetR/AcrR family transcriptional regulator [Mycolicibacterium sp. 624]|uniref:TetR/AcrR family transcriptional regulator n=1 Tax=Mycolicibacterium sp. 624 TaxID=3156314 RepID=UPI00339AB9F1